MTASIISNRIHPLAPILIDKIAAGEVIDGPYSVIKELVENAIDAGASHVRIDTFGGGMDKIIIQDNGAGIHYDDLPNSVQRHATSKITELDDIENILTFGFRGEALASIGSVSHLEIKSIRNGARSGGLIENRGGEILRYEPAALNEGTTITVSELFYSTPARKKFAKAEKTENIRNYKEIIKIALANPGVHFVYYRDTKEFLNLPPLEDLKDRIGKIYKTKITNHLLEVKAVAPGIILRGFITDENYHRANRDGQYQYVNQRHVELKNFSFLVKKGYGEILPPGAHPYYFLFLEIDPAKVDVNVHPAKKEVRLTDGGTLNSLVINAIASTLRPNEPVAFNRYYAPSRANSEAPGKTPDLIPPASNGSSALTDVDNVLLSDSSVQNMPSYGVTERNFETLQGNTQNSGLFAGAGPAHEINPGQVSESGGPADGSNEQKQGFLPRRHYGVIFGTYILAEGEDAFYIIDQHTAHERINYEKVRRNLERLRGERQPLLHPISVDVQADELDAILEKKDLLLECGFVIEEFGPSAYLVNEVPGYLDAGSETQIIKHAIERILEGEEDYRVYDELAAMKACKASIKKNDYVAGEVLTEILIELSKCENPSRCPHGRPTMVKMTQNELDRMFHRIS